MSMNTSMTLEQIREELLPYISRRPVEIPQSGLLAGGVFPVKGYRPLRFGWDNAHFPMGYALLMDEGLPGIIRRARAPREGLDERAQAYRALIADTYEAIRLHVLAHAEKAEAMARENPADARRLTRIALNCRTLASQAPQTFEQGVQLFWFMWRLRSAFTSCIGRMDVHLRRLYDRDVPERMPREEALDLLCELWNKLNDVYSGDTLMNLMLGGVDEEGADVSCDLSCLIMEATMRVRRSEPHINVRIHPGTPERFKQTAAELIAQGQGQGVLYYDEQLIPSLVRRGIPLQYARVYANDGCTELTFDGHSGIWFWQMETVKTLELTLFRGAENPSTPYNQYYKWTRHGRADVFKTHLALGHDSGDVAAMTSFEQVYRAFLDQYGFQIRRQLETMIAPSIVDNETTTLFNTSPIVAGLVPRALDEGVDPMRGGWEVKNYQLLSGSIPTAADGLYAVKEAVFEQKLCTMEQLIAALRDDFAGHEELRRQLQRLPKFGNDHDGVDLLAADIARFFCEQVERFEAPMGVKILPGIYNIDFNMFSGSIGATPDGRKGGDLICEHYSPTPGTAKNGPTAVIHSAAKADLKRGCASSPLYLALPRGMGAVDTRMIRGMIDVLNQMELPIVSISIYDRSVLEDAVIHPERHEDLVVRVWGFNARFIDLDDALQKHVMARIL